MWREVGRGCYYYDLMDLLLLVSQLGFNHSVSIAHVPSYTLEFKLLLALFVFILENGIILNQYATHPLRKSRMWR